MYLMFNSSNFEMCRLMIQIKMRLKKFTVIVPFINLVNMASSIKINLIPIATRLVINA